MAVIAIEGGVVAVAGVGGVAVNALPSVPAGDGGVKTRSSAVPPDPSALVHLPLQIHRHAVHTQATQATQKGP